MEVTAKINGHVDVMGIKETSLMKRIKDRIGWDKRISCADVHVSAKSGQVTVFGKVDSKWRMDAAAETIAATKGVTKVINQIEISTDVLRSDSDLKVLLDRKIHELRLLDSENINVYVDHGVVKLDGLVLKPQTKAAAAGYVWELSGVRDCENKLQIKEEGTLKAETSFERPVEMNTMVQDVRTPMFTSSFAL